MNKLNKPMSENARKLIAYEQQIQEETRRFVANTLLEYRETLNQKGDTACQPKKQKPAVGRQSKKKPSKHPLRTGRTI